MPARLKSNLLVFLFCFSLLASNGYVWLVNHVPMGDARAYLLMARGEVASISSVHRYRVVVPLLARWVAEGLGSGRALLSGWPASLPLGLAFYLVNTTLLALVGVFIYRTAQRRGASGGAAALGVVAVLTSGVATFLAGSALVDSLTLLLIAVLYYALAARASGWLLVAIVGCLLVKEQLALLLPVAFYYGRFVPWSRRLLAAVTAVLLLYSLRYGLDAWYPLPEGTASKSAAQLILAHTQDHLLGTLRYLFSLGGIGTALGVFGGFNLLLLLGGSGGATGRASWLGRLPPGTAALLACTGVFILLSGDVSRMLFMASPCVGVAVALIADYHPALRLVRQHVARSVR